MSDQRIPRGERPRVADRSVAPLTDPAPDGFEADAPLRRPRPAASRNRRALSRGLRFAGLGALTVGVVLGVYVSGLPQPAASSTLPAGHPAVTATAAPTATPTVDQARAAALKAKVDANPKDLSSLKALSDLYGEAGEYAQAASWQGRIVELTPTDTDARLILGVYHFNDADYAAAETQWLEVVRQDPKKAEAFYDLGFLYLAQSPPQTTKAQQMWQTVVDIAPESAIAQTAASHLSALSSAGEPSASPSNG